MRSLLDRRRNDSPDVGFQASCSAFEIFVESLVCGPVMDLLV